MSEQQVKKLTIVGGGSAGWMTAIHLNKVFNSTKKTFDITVIESPDIGIIGVGEATVHSVRFFFAALGLDENELMRETNASLKLGIMFRNWMKPVDGKTHEYFHPFEHQPLGREVDISSNWFLTERYKKERYDEGVSLSVPLLKAGHGPKGPATRQYQGVVPYGYHIDAVLLARYLRRKSVEAGVTHIEGTITDVTVEGQNIKSVHTEDASYEADIFIDCTGFRGMLIDKVKADNWDSFTDALPCNKAVAIQREFDEGEGPDPYTTATALSNGWAWKIGLVNRLGTGYVYDGNRISADQAEAELREFIGITDENLIKSNHLNMRVGCRHEFWVGNVLATGLAGGFIEPLESTGLHLINLAAGLMSTHLANDNSSQAVRDNFNRLMRGFYQDLKQFIVLHYCLSNRDDSDFWRSAPATVEHCEWLKNQLEVWKHKVCEYQDLAGAFSTVFADENYRYILYGMQHYPNLQMNMDTELNQAMYDTLRKMGENALSATSPHINYLKQLNL